MQLFNDDEYEVIRCENCGEELTDESQRRWDDTECVNCFENPECPEYCNEEHDEPEPDHYGQWRCPTTGTLYTRNAGEWEVQGRYEETSTYIDLDDEWYIYPGDYGFDYCESCDEWRYQDAMRYDRYGDQRGCEYCSHYNDSGFMPAPDPTTCEHCGTHAVLTHWDPVTEQVSCATCAVGEPIPVLQAA